jgi:hypothetical protein
VTGPKVITKAKRKRDDDDDDHRLKPAHRFADVGPAIDPCYRPVVSANPEQTLAALAEVFLRLGRDYAGALPADHALRSLMQTANVLHTDTAALTSGRNARHRQRAMIGGAAGNASRYSATATRARCALTTSRRGAGWSRTRYRCARRTGL